MLSVLGVVGVQRRSPQALVYGGRGELAVWPGAGITDLDRDEARALLDACRTHGVLPEVMHLASRRAILGVLLGNPHRLGKRYPDRLGRRAATPARPPQRASGTYRVIYRIDDGWMTVTVLDVVHRQDAHRRSG